MKTEVTNNGAKINYSESFWTGKREIIFNGVQLTQKARNVYTDNSKDYTIKGNFLTGVTLNDGMNTYVIYEKFNALQYILIILPFLLVLFGGAIGGFLGALAGCCNAYFMRFNKNIGAQIIICLASTAIAVALYFIAAFLILGLI